MYLVKKDNDGRFRTRKLENESEIPETLKAYLRTTTSSINLFYADLEKFKQNNDYDNLEQYYKVFRIRKRNGKFRVIHEITNPKLTNLLDLIKTLLYNVIRLYPTNSAYAYIRKRNAKQNAEVHKNSNFFLKLDLKDFFTSITEKIIIKELLNMAKIQYLKAFDIDVEQLVKDIAHIATVNGVLVQGSPLSPLLSNLVMVNFDYKLVKAMIDNKIPSYKYTRYCDDMILSAKANHNTSAVIEYIKKILKEDYDGSIKINYSKTQYIRVTSRCYLTGAKINKDHKVTYGHEKKKELKTKLFYYYKSVEDGTATSEDFQKMQGILAYVDSIEPGYGKYLFRLYNRIFNMNLVFHI